MIYDILGCKRLKEGIITQKDIDKYFRGLGNCPPASSQTEVRYTDVIWCLDIAVFSHLGFDVSHLDVSQYVQEGSDIAVDYFFGDYLQTDEHSKVEMEKNADNEYLSWFEVYRNGLHLAHMAQDTDAAKRLVDWIEPWLPFDESSFLLTPYDNHYHKLLAEYIKTGTLVSQTLHKEIENSRKQRPKLLLGCLLSLCEKDNTSFSQSLKKFLIYMLKSEFGERISTHFSIEGSILCHVAKRAGIEPTGLTEKQAALIMTRESLGLAG